MSESLAGTIKLEEKIVTDEVVSQFSQLKFSEPDSMAFLSGNKGEVVGLGVILKDADGNETKFAMQASVFVAWSIQVAQQIGASYKKMQGKK